VNAAFVVVAGVGAFLLAYRFYSKFLADRVFGLDYDRETPAHTRRDGVDFVPARRSILFGHHFASIAGLAPIAGPALAVIWGWLPALVWIVVGTVFLGAVHDFAALAVSLKHEGRSIGDLTGSILGPRGRILFLVVVFFLLALAMGVFALIVGQLFGKVHPEAVIPVFGLMVLALLIGVAVYKFRVSILAATLVGLALMFLLIWVGLDHPMNMYRLFLRPETREAISAGLDSGELAASTQPGAVAAYLSEQGAATMAEEVAAAGESAAGAWIVILLVYALVASVLPVWLLLQPRDYLNSYQLYIGVGALFLGALVTHPKMSAPAYNHLETLPNMIPLLFVTIACGAISGFHSLVSSGTTARQLSSARDARLIAYGGMLTEGTLALLVVAACAAGCGARWSEFYADWGTISGGLASKLQPFFVGAGSFLSGLGVPRGYGASLMAVMVVGFAMTTLDSGTRLLRYNIEEFADTVRLKRYFNRYLASALAVLVLAAVAFWKVPTVAGGKVSYVPAGLYLWRLFGTTNQMLAALGLLVVSVFLVKIRRPAWYTAVPFAFMLAVTAWSMVAIIGQAWSGDDPRSRAWSIVIVGAVLLLVAVALAVESLLRVLRERGLREEASVEKASREHASGEDAAAGEEAGGEDIF